jgi:hypothetical protein
MAKSSYLDDCQSGSIKKLQKQIMDQFDNKYIISKKLGIILKFYFYKRKI